MLSLRNSPKRREILNQKHQREILNHKHQKHRQKKPKAPTVRRLAKKKKSSNKRKFSNDTTDEEDDCCYCLVCLDSYSNGKSGEMWDRWILCKGWAHVQCTMSRGAYVCHNCDSDSSEFYYWLWTSKCHTPIYVETYVGVYDSRTITARRNATQILPTRRLLTQSISPTMDKQDPVVIFNPLPLFSCE